MGNLSISDIRGRLLLDRPYFGAAAMNLKPVEVQGLGTMAVDKGWRLYYDPAALAKWTNSECAAVFEHELMHLLRDHSGRQLGRDHQQWNVAGDMEINDDISGLPAGCCTPSAFGLPDGKTAEEYFDLLPKGGGGGQGPGQPGPDCGSGAGGEKRPWELPEDGDGQGLSPLEQEAVRRQTAEAVRRAGNAPAGLQRWADEILTPPRIPWSKILPNAIRTAVSQGTPQRYRFPSRRQTGAVIMPRLVSNRPAAALVVDTSGSITDKDLALAVALIRAATKHADLTLYACDTEAVRVARLAPGCLVGGGGTNMMAGVQAAMEGKPKPHAIIIITDCYSPWDADAPKVPVVILTANPDQAPKWAKVVTIEGEV